VLVFRFQAKRRGVKNHDIHFGGVWVVVLLGFGLGVLVGGLWLWGFSVFVVGGVNLGGKFGWGGLGWWVVLCGGIQGQ